MTPEQIEKVGVITPEFREEHPGAHFCADWDFMVIWKGTPEWDACLCTVKNLPDPNGADSA